MEGPYDKAAEPPAPSPQRESFFLDNIIVGYAFGPKKMETMGLIMAEASKALMSTIPYLQHRQDCSPFGGGGAGGIGGVGGCSNVEQQQVDVESSSTVTMTTMGATSSSECCLERHHNHNHHHCHPQQRVAHHFPDNDPDEDFDTRSMSSTYTTRSSCLSQRSRGGNCGGVMNMNGIQLTFIPDTNGLIHLVGSAGGTGGMGGGLGCEGESVAESSSVTTLATTLTSKSSVVRAKHHGNATAMLSSASSLSPCPSNEMNDVAPGGGGGQAQPEGQASVKNTSGSSAVAERRHHPIRVSFVPIDLDTPLEEQHGGKFDVILHKMTEDILCMSKMLRARGQSCGNDAEVAAVRDMLGFNGMEWSAKPLETDVARADDSNASSSETVVSKPKGEGEDEEGGMTRHQARASRRIGRLREYKQRVRPSCVLVDSPADILAVMSRADMAEVLSRCLAGVTTRGGVPVRTPRFRVVEDEEENWCDDLNQPAVVGDASSSAMAAHIRQQNAAAALADEIDMAGFEYPLIAKPLTAAGTKSSHHMGIVLARDGLQRLKTPCLLQEYANHGQKLFKVYVLGESVWVFSRESLPNLPAGEKMQRELSNRDERCVGGGGGGTPSPTRKRPRTESYVEFERPAGSRCYVEFNSQRPYPKLSDFGIVSESSDGDASSKSDASLRRLPKQDVPSEHCDSQESKKRRRADNDETRLASSCGEGAEHQQLSESHRQYHCADTDRVREDAEDLAKFVTKDEIEPVTNALRDAFGLELFGFDVLVKHNSSKCNKDNGSPAKECKSDIRDDGSGKEILVVDVNYFPGYKEVPNFPSLLAQYLTKKAVESRMETFCR